ncbi:MAG: D-aminoacyl-tRNA deacylase [Thermomicrobiales bacterium]
MRALLQRVTRASVTVDGELISEIGTGFLILLGVTQDDTAEEGAFLAGKVANLRVFEDDAGAMNRSASICSAMNRLTWRCWWCRNSPCTPMRGKVAGQVS